MNRRRVLFSLALVGLAASTALAGSTGSVSGTYVEARTAEVFAGGCAINSEAGTMGRQAVLAWKVDRGSVNGVNLDGLGVVAAVAGDRNLGIQELGGERAMTKAAIYVDQRANAAQRIALITMAQQLSNGIVGAIVDVVPTVVQFADDGNAIRIAAGHVTLDVDKHTEHDPICGAMQWFHPLSSVSQATIGLAERHAFTGSSLGTRWSDPNKRSAFFGAFVY